MTTTHNRTAEGGIPDRGDITGHDTALPRSRPRGETGLATPPEMWAKISLEGRGVLQRFALRSVLSPPARCHV